MPPSRSQRARCPIVLRGFLRLADCRRTFEPNPEINVFTVCYPTLDPSAPVSSSAQPPIRLTRERIIVLATWHFCPPET
jgi:hypothetical protein